MKKIISVLVVLTLLSVVFTGCSNKKGKGTAQSLSEQVQHPTQRFWSRQDRHLKQQAIHWKL